MNWMKENKAPAQGGIIGGFLMNIGIWWLVIGKPRAPSLTFMLCLILICVGCWLITWWFHEEHPTRFQKMSKERLRFCQITTHVCSWVSLVLVVFTLCYAVYQI